MNAQYVARLLMELQRDFQGLHERMNNIENIRYLEDDIGLPAEEKTSGLEIRIGAVGELIENVKAALTSNVPQVVIKPLRSGDPANENSNKREKFHKANLKWINNPVPVLNELSDGQAGPGIGILKGIFYPWPKKERKRLKGESDAKYKDRQQALKRMWGPPFRTVTVHPLSFYFRLGDGNQIEECIEHSWKSKRVMYANYGEPTGEINKPVTGDAQLHVAATSGQPDETIRPLPVGSGTDTLVKVTEYWTPDLYQIYVGTEKVFEQSPPSVRYFMAVGRTTSSKDPDKFGMSVAELLSHNEPTINRTLTRIAEAAEITVRKRLTVELPEGTEDTELGPDNQPQARTWRFKADVAEALPAGARIQDPFAGVENVFQALPWVQFVLEIQGLHGVSPIFKGIPPGAAGSGYRDNSIYMMALSQFQYLLDSYAGCLVEYIRWMEQQLKDTVRQEIWVDELSLTPNDIRDFPAIIEINITPLLPQNIIAMGNFYASMYAQGHGTKRMVIEKGMREEQPEEIMWARFLENIQSLLEPELAQDVLQHVGAIRSQPGLVGPNGQPISSGGPGGGPGGVQELMTEMARRKGNGAGAVGQSMAGQARGGQPRQPPEVAGATPGLTE